MQENIEARKDLNPRCTRILKLSGNAIDILEDREIVLSREELRGMLDTLGDGLVDIYNDHKIEVNILMMRSSINRNLTEWFSNALAQIFSSNYGVDINSRELHPSKALSGMDVMYFERNTPLTVLLFLNTLASRPLIRTAE